MREISTFVDSSAERISLILRVLLGTAGAYFFSLMMAAAIGLAMPEPRVDGARLAIIIGFIVQPLAVMWVFGCRSLLTAFLGMVIPVTVLGIYILSVWPEAVA